MKGPSCLTDLPSFVIIKGMSVDYMHQAILGVERQLLSLWFLSGKSHRRMVYWSMSERYRLLSSVYTATTGIPTATQIYK